MSVLSLRLPDSLHRKIREIAASEGISLNQFIATPVAEKTSALLTEDYLAARAARGNREAYLAALDLVPDVEPAPEDRL